MNFAKLIRTQRERWGLTTRQMEARAREAGYPVSHPWFNQKMNTEEDTSTSPPGWDTIRGAAAGIKEHPFVVFVALAVGQGIAPDEATDWARMVVAKWEAGEPLGTESVVGASGLEHAQYLIQLAAEEVERAVRSRREREDPPPAQRRARAVPASPPRERVSAKLPPPRAMTDPPVLFPTECAVGDG